MSKKPLAASTKTPDNYLKGKWIAITRPAHQAQTIQKKLEKAGAHVVLFPLLEIAAPSDPERCKEQLAKADEYDLLIFVSSNAVEQSLKWLPAPLPESVKIAAVGKKTAAILQQRGMPPDIFPRQHFNSETLLAMPEMQDYYAVSKDGKPKNIAVIRGEGGRNKLRDTLLQHGANVDHVNVYRRVCPQTNADLLKQHWRRGELDIIVLTSGTSVENLFQLANGEEWLKQTKLLLGSRRIQQHIPEHYRGGMLYIDNPSDETLYSALNDLWRPIPDTPWTN